jgi:hypothetical protein
MGERAVSAVPTLVPLLLAGAFCAQIGFKAWEPRPGAQATDLPAAPPVAAARLASLGEPLGLAQGLNLYLQAFDTQPGISIPFQDLDYATVQAWLGLTLELDPAGQYPMLMASQVYPQVPLEAKQRQMLDWVHQRFLEDPDQRWRWLAHGAIVAKHRLHDLTLALRYAQDIDRYARGPQVPHWARQMHIFLLEDMGEYEAAKILLGGLLSSGTVTDHLEAHFLMERLNALGHPAEKSSLPSESRLR